MALVKTEEEIQAMREGGKLLSSALQAAVDIAKPGVTMRELDEAATKVIEDGGGTPSFLGYKGGGEIPFPSTVCISRNEEIVHGVGNRDIALEEGDIVGLDIGCWYKDLCTDMAVTIPIGSVSDDYMALLRDTRESMYAGVEQAKPGNTVHDISGAVEDSIDLKKYGVVRALVGHGVGHEVHEKPSIPNFRSKSIPNADLVENMCIAIEPMVTGGSHEIKTAEDGWTITTIDGSRAAHFEVTVAILKEGPEILTPQPDINI
jgi:methionyl aminopeptidase